MPFTDLATPPTPPQRTDDPETFITRADAFVAWQEQFAEDLDTFITELEACAALIAAAPEYADPGLLAMTGHTPAANRFIYFTSETESSLATITTAALSLLNDGTGAAMRETIGVVIGTDVAAAGANTDITALDQDVTITATGTVAANSIGFRGLPDSGQTPGSGITLALADAGKMVANTTGGFTIPANGSIAFPVGTTIVLYNNSGSAQNIAITTDTLRWSGTTSTGTRSLQAYGLATLVKVASTTWVVSGAVL